MENRYRLEAVMCTTAGVVGFRCGSRWSDLAMPSVSEYFPCEDGVVPRVSQVNTKGARKTPGHHMSTTELCSPTFHAGVTGSFSLR